MIPNFFSMDFGKRNKQLAQASILKHSWLRVNLRTLTMFNNYRFMGMSIGRWA